MYESTISFPGLGIDSFTVDNVAFYIFGRPIAWYALFITLGMVCCFIYVVLKAKKIGINMDTVIDYALFTIPIGVVGARLLYVISNLDFYLDKRNYDNFFQGLISIPDGGLAIYGGIICGALTVLCVSKFKKISFFGFGDCVAPGVILAQGIGRWGNFMNGEAYGTVSNGLFRMGLYNYNTTRDTLLEKAGADITKMVYVHPTFLYESVWNISGFILVNLYSKFIGKKYDGQLILLTFGWYGLGRMIFEGLRTDPLQPFLKYGIELRINQLIAALAFIICLSLLIFFAIKKPKSELFVYEGPSGNEEKKDVDKGENSESVAFFEKVKSFFGIKSNKVDEKQKKGKNKD